MMKAGAAQIIGGTILTADWTGRNGAMCLVGYNFKWMNCPLPALTMLGTIC